MANRTESVNYWQQFVLFPPGAVEITVRVGVVQESAHVQAQIEVHNAATGELLGMRSWPHIAGHDINQKIIDVLREAHYVIDYHLQPFPA